jgi:hypothetical protein
VIGEVGAGGVWAAPCVGQFTRAARRMARLARVGEAP